MTKKWFMLTSECIYTLENRWSLLTHRSDVMRYPAARIEVLNAVAKASNPAIYVLCFGLQRQFLILSSYMVWYLLLSPFKHCRTFLQSGRNRMLTSWYWNICIWLQNRAKTLALVLKDLSLPLTLVALTVSLLTDVFCGPFHAVLVCSWFLFAVSLACDPCKLNVPPHNIATAVLWGPKHGT